MELSRRHVLKLAAGGAIAAGFRTRAEAADFPTKAVTVICPWPAGGSTDIQMRALAEATESFSK